MKKYIHFCILISLFGLAGCELTDKAEEEYEKIEEKATEEYERIVHQYEEYTGAEDDRGERPFTVVYQKDTSKKTRLISAQCSSNEALRYVYYDTPEDAHSNYNHEISNFISYTNQSKLKPFWDIRYVDPVTKYINGESYEYYADHSKYTGLDVRTGDDNIGIGTDTSKNDASGSIVQLECINDALTGGSTINLFDAPTQSLTYGGPHTSFKYSLGSTSLTSPWRSNKTGNIMIQSNFNAPLYISHSENSGAGVYFGLFLYNKHIGKHLNYVIGIFAAGEAWVKEKAGIRYDPTTKVVHVATVAKESSWWSTISPLSRSIQEIFKTSDSDTHDTQEWNNFYRVNISYQNLLAVLHELKKNPPADVAGEDFGLSPEEWEISSIMIQHELEEVGGEAIFSSSFRGFEAYLSDDPL